MRPAKGPRSPVHKKDILLVALGGNALIRKGQVGTIDEQFENLLMPVGQIAKLAATYRIIITHGNGPQVGNLLLQQECCDTVPRLPLEILVAQTQGQIGYMIESTIDQAFMETDMTRNLVSLLSYVVVDRNDPAFSRPSKPIGPVYTKEEAALLPFLTGKTGKGYRQLVASPRPKTIVEKQEIRILVDQDFVVICCGGGGIPVIREGRKFHGVDAVVDKDLVSAKLAEELGVDLFLMATDVPGACLNFGDEKKQRFLSSISSSEATDYLKEDHFAAGSMGPKVEAAIEFINNGGKKAIITSIDTIDEAVKGQAGTVITA
jgi:carbamate kinase